MNMLLYSVLYLVLVSIGPGFVNAPCPDLTGCLPDCPPGTYVLPKHTRDNETNCHECALGTWSAGKTYHCTACPAGMTTRGVGSQSQNACIPEGEVACQHWTDAGVCNTQTGCSYGCHLGICWKQTGGSGQNCTTSDAYCYQPERKCQAHSECSFSDECIDATCNSYLLMSVCDIQTGCSYGCYLRRCWKETGDNCTTTEEHCFQARTCQADTDCSFSEECANTINGGWSVWSEWSTCDSYCVGGSQGRTRACDNNSVVGTGTLCNGDPSETQHCNTDVPCPVNGGWNVWSEWSTCNSYCVGGSQGRTRTCDNPSVVGTGTLCNGDPSETQHCNTDVPCPVNGGWSVWSEWSTCDSYCVGGSQGRTRACDNPSVVGTGTLCNGDSSETQHCNTDVPCPEKPTEKTRVAMATVTTTIIVVVVVVAVVIGVIAVVIIVKKRRGVAANGISHDKLVYKVNTADEAEGAQYNTTDNKEPNDVIKNPLTIFKKALKQSK